MGYEAAFWMLLVMWLLTYGLTVYAQWSCNRVVELAAEERKAADALIATLEKSNGLAMDYLRKIAGSD